MSQMEEALKRLMATAVDASAKQSTFRGMIYGNDGTGKTVLGAMILKALCEKEPMLYIDTSEGYVSLRNIKGLSDGFKVLPFTTYEDLRLIAKAIKDKVGPFGNIKGIMLDEFSSMTDQDANRVYEARLAGAYGPKEQQLAKEQGGKEGRDYMFSLERFQKMYDDLFDLRDVHLITVAHQKDVADRNGNVIRIEPNFSPKIGKYARKSIHLVANITSESVKDPSDLKAVKYKRTAQVHPDLMTLAKCRLPIKTTRVDASTLPGIIKEWAQFGGAEPIEDEDILDETVVDETAEKAAASNLFD